MSDTKNIFTTKSSCSDLHGKVALLTGASKGMGYATAETLCAAGMHVCLVARHADQLDEARVKLEAIAADNRIVTVCGDVGDPNLPGLAVETCRSELGGVHVLVNNAGGPPPGSFLDHDEMNWRSAIDVNLLSVVRFSKAVAPIMKSQRWGRIISITSTIAKEPTPTMVLSATTRAGVAAFTKCIAVELAPFEITVNAVLPGGVLTERLHDLFGKISVTNKTSVEEELKKAQASIPIGRFASPQEIACFILFLASPQGSYLTGLNIPVDGGLTKGVF